MISRPAMPASPGSMLEIQNLSLYPRLTESEIAFLQNCLAIMHIKF